MEHKIQSPPLVSVITISLNHAKYLKETIKSIEDQTYQNIEHIVVDGGSKDGTLEILESFKSIRWISESDNGPWEAILKGINLSRGKYIIQCCVSDGYINVDWITNCVKILEEDIETSLVWGLPVYVDENKNYIDILYKNLITFPPKQKIGFLGNWLANKFTYPEGNYCIRAEVLRKCYPVDKVEGWMRVQPHLAIVYKFMIGGYLATFLPQIAHYFRAHLDQRSKRLISDEKPAATKYLNLIESYKDNLLSESYQHIFRDGRSNKIHTLERVDLINLRLEILRCKIIYSRFMNKTLLDLIRHLLKN